MAPRDSGPEVTWDTHPLGWRQALFLAVKSRLVYLTGWEGNFWVQPTMPVPKLAEVLVSDKDTTVGYMWRKVKQ